VLLVCATFPLIWVGGLVTTTQAGMAVPDWPNTYGYNLFLYPLSTWLAGPWDLFIEHGHRLLGALVGLITIALLIALWRWDERPAVRWLGVIALAAVVGQGVLGGMRVLLDARTLAKIHGCTGPIFFALAVALAAVTSRHWRSPKRPESDDRPRVLAVRRLAALTTLVAYVQLALGAQIRHLPVGLSHHAFRVAVIFHLLFATVLAVHVCLLAGKTLRGCRAYRWLARPAWGLAALLLVQLALGVSTWIVKYGWPTFLPEGPMAAYTVTAGSFAQATIVTAHVATGSLILVTSLLIALRAFRLGSLAEISLDAETSASSERAAQSEPVTNLNASLGAAALAGGLP